MTGGRCRLPDAQRDRGETAHASACWWRPWECSARAWSARPATRAVQCAVLRECGESNNLGSRVCHYRSCGTWGGGCDAGAADQCASAFCRGSTCRNSSAGTQNQRPSFGSPGGPEESASDVESSQVDGHGRTSCRTRSDCPFSSASRQVLQTPAPPRGQSRRPSGPAEMVTRQAHWSPDRPQRRRVQRTVGPSQVGDRADDVVAVRLPQTQPPATSAIPATTWPISVSPQPCAATSDLSASPPRTRAKAGVTSSNRVGARTLRGRRGLLRGAGSLTANTRGTKILLPIKEL